jgi:hypothetical protein
VIDLTADTPAEESGVSSSRIAATQQPGAISVATLPVTPAGTVLHFMGDALVEAAEESVSAFELRHRDDEDVGELHVDIDDFLHEDEEDEYGGDGDEEEEEQGEADRVEETEDLEAQDRARLLLRIMELRHIARQIGLPELAPEVAPRLIRFRTLLEQVSVLHGGMSEEAIEACTLTMTYSGPAGPEVPGDSSGVNQRQCMICLDDFQAGDRLRVLPCFHRYHAACVDNWFSRSSRCPVCKHDVTCATDDIETTSEDVLVADL